MAFRSFLLTDSAEGIFYNNPCENEFIHRRAVCSKCLDEYGNLMADGDLLKIPEERTLDRIGSRSGRTLELSSDSASVLFPCLAASSMG